MGTLDSMAAPVAAELIDGKALTLQQRMDFAWFLAAQITRTPRFFREFARPLEDSAQMQMAIAAGIPGYLEGRLGGATKANQLRRELETGRVRFSASKAEVLSAAIGAPPDAARIIDCMDWTIEHWPTAGRPLLTSDDPLIVLNAECGLCSPSVRLILPLSPQTCFTAVHNPELITTLRGEGSAVDLREYCQRNGNLAHVEALAGNVTDRNNQTCRNAQAAIFSSEGTYSVTAFISYSLGAR